MSPEQAAMVKEETRRLDSHGVGYIRVYSDMTKCLRCDKVWDTNDPIPPYCGAPNAPRKLHPTIAILIVIAPVVVVVLVWALIT